jgi:hypothetical protein
MTENSFFNELSAHRQLTKLEDFSLEQLSIFIVAVLAGASACLLACFKSKCDRIETPCLKIHRNPEAITEPQAVLEREVIRRNSITPPLPEVMDVENQP